jgi:HD-like signal output (HDOD) protein
MEHIAADPWPVVPAPIPPDDVARRVVRRADVMGPSASLFRLEDRLRHGDTSALQLGHLIEGSPALAARVLRLANSAYYAPSEPVVSLRRAVILLGDTVLRQLVLTSLISSRRATARTPRQSLAAARLLGDAVRSAVVCRTLAAVTRLVGQDDAFVAGLLHDLGHIYLLDDDDDRYAGYLLGVDDHLDGLANELVLRGTTHTHVGAAFADTWHLPGSVKEVLAGHHDPAPGTLSAIVRVSDWLVCELDPPASLDTPSADAPGTVSERVESGLAMIGLERAVWAARVPVVREEYSDLLTLFDPDLAPNLP